MPLQSHQASRYHVTLARRALQGDGVSDGHVTFNDAVREARKDDFHLDTYALRALVFQTPQSVKVPGPSAFLTVWSSL